MNMMNWEELFAPRSFLMSRNMPWRTLETELENFSGLVRNLLKDYGSDSIQKNSQRSEPNISIEHTSEPNTITIRTMTIQLPSDGISSNTTTPLTSPQEEVAGSSKEPSSTSQQQSTSPTQQERSPTVPASSSSELTETKTTTS